MGGLPCQSRCDCRLALRAVLLCLVTFPTIAYSEDESANTTVVDADDELIFGHLTLTALVVASVATFILAICTAVACYYDFSNMDSGVAKLEVYPETDDLPLPEVLQPTTSAETEYRSEETAKKTSELAAEAKELEEILQPPSRSDAMARQAKIIEAICNATGREVPPQFKMKDKSAEKIRLPEHIQETLQGIADKDEPGEGSPATSPSRLAKMAKELSFNLPKLEKEQQEPTDLTTTTTLRDIWARPIDRSRARNIKPMQVVETHIPSVQPLQVAATQYYPVQGTSTPLDVEATQYYTVQTPGRSTADTQRSPFSQGSSKQNVKNAPGQSQASAASKATKSQASSSLEGNSTEQQSSKNK
ncbi:unnamed protein product [Cylicocyclus nassatus]|uniref:Uncharacterized protein n=1 Tax=Cylicocyclus nassatus TaxID=53992 RepID=A0AA36GCT8_CYLNA|nr:unnamed protein product [Cylicocyclus nassatus]